MRGSKIIPSLVPFAFLVSLTVGCRDSAPEAPPPPGPQENFAKDMRSLKGTLPAPPDEIARAANSVFKRMGLSNVTTITQPRWAAVVQGQKPSGMRSPYMLRVRSNGEGSYDSYVEVEVGLMGDEAESRYIIGEISRDLNLGSNAPPPSDLPPSDGPPSDGPPIDAPSSGS